MHTVLDQSLDNPPPFTGGREVSSYLALMPQRIFQRWQGVTATDGDALQDLLNLIHNRASPLTKVVFRLCLRETISNLRDRTYC